MITEEEQKSFEDSRKEFKEKLNELYITTCWRVCSGNFEKVSETRFNDMLQRLDIIYIALKSVARCKSDPASLMFEYSYPED